MVDLQINSIFSCLLRGLQRHKGGYRLPSGFLIICPAKIPKAEPLTKRTHIFMTQHILPYCFSHVQALINSTVIYLLLTLWSSANCFPPYFHTLLRLFFRKSPIFSQCCFSVAQSCLTLCNPRDYSTPHFPVHHYLLELAHPHVH